MSLNVVDSCGWLEYFANGSNADFFAPAIEAAQTLVVPSLTLFEVFKRVLQQRNEADALRAVALMRQAPVIALSDALAIGAAQLSAALHLPLADSIILHTARDQGATLWTQDAHFANVQGVRYRHKQAPDAAQR
ncbi:type II toxin-antitoxin system VapC family toxin [Comamonas badia]|uniref:type II toxin-antitoxin system VapC family toxin n=1 Tax=Comamonas badia TaxID=265291 RepID=UPI0004206B8E|nr:type II toxin-antitoxin system VapC family toxin [Comamonas badia]